MNLKRILEGPKKRNYYIMHTIKVKSLQLLDELHAGRRQLLNGEILTESPYIPAGI